MHMNGKVSGRERIQLMKSDRERAREGRERQEESLTQSKNGKIEGGKGRLNQ